MKIKYRLLASIVIPTAGLLLALGVLVNEKWETVRSMEQLGERAQLVTGANNLVHELQRERGLSAIFLGSHGTQMTKELTEERKRTDERLKLFEQLAARTTAVPINNPIHAKLDDAVKRLNDLAAKRDAISALKINAADSSAYFTDTIAQLLAVGSETAKRVGNEQIVTELLAYTYFSQAKERAGQERATIGLGLAMGKFDSALQRKLLSILAEQQQLIQIALFYASPEEKAFYDHTVTGDAVTEVERIRQLAITAAPGEPVTVEGAHWYGVATARIDLLKRIEDNLAGNLARTTTEVAASARQMLWVVLGAAAIIMSLTALIGFLMARSIVRPVGAMTDAMTRLAGGDVGVEIPARANTDEIGEMAKAVQVFKDNMVESEHLRAEQTEQKRQAEERQRQAMLALADSFEDSVGDVLRMVSSAATELQATAQSMSAVAEETERQSTAVAAASEQASTNVQTVASAAEELSSSIAEISRQVASSSDITARAVEDTRRTNEQIQGLAEAAQSIGDVVKLISDIASQTNLLALNATIEAARAGDAGKGFAVVASEVKSLADQTAKATEEIGGKIAEMQVATSHSVEAVQEIGQTIARINEIATAIAAAVEEQGSATQEIARNVQQVSAGTTEVSQNIVGVTRAANDTGAASTQVLGTAGELSRQSEALKSQVESFLGNIRAA
jgi:methyl-accepting chemotaxis protein